MWDMQFWKPHDFRGTLYSEAFEVADYEFDIGFSKFKMADPIYGGYNILETQRFLWNFVLQGFWGR